MDWEIDGISLLGVVLGCVEILRKFKVPAQWLPIGAVAIGIGLGVLAQAMTLYPHIAPWGMAGLRGAVIGLTATGLYAMTMRVVDKVLDKAVGKITSYLKYRS